MTKEEAQKIIEYTFLNADGHLKPLDFDYEGGKGIVEALRMAIEALSQPSLPSNLDDAARYYEEHRGQALNSDNKECRRAFKAGAEWMAGEGVTIEDVVCELYDELYLYYIDNCSTVTPDTSCGMLKELGANKGDKVIVQIRKK